MNDLIEKLIQQRRTLVVELCDHDYDTAKSPDKISILQKEITRIDELILKLSGADLVTIETTEV